MIGLLWFDASKKKDLATKIAEAAKRHQVKYGRRPNICYVNETMLGQETDVDGIRVVPAHNVLKHHFFIGVESERELREAA